MKRLYKSVICLILAITMILSGFTFVSAKNNYMDVVEKYVDTVLDVGRNVKGSPYPLLFVDGINTVTKEPVVWYQDGEVYVPSNLASQQIFLRVLDTLSDVKGDPKYENIAKEQLQFYFDNLADDSGLLYWGGHQWIDKTTGNVVGEQPSHEFKGHYPYYKLMFETDPEATEQFIEAMWNAHISDWSILSFNRHGKYDKAVGELWDSQYENPEPYYKGDEKDLTFINAGSDLIYAAMMLYMHTGDERPHMWAKRLFQLYMDARDPVTKLGAYQFSQLNEAGGGDRAQAQFGPEFGERALDGRVLLSASTAIYGQAMLSFMYAAENTNDTEMLNYAFECLRAFYTYAYVPEVNKFTPMFTDGTSLLGYESPREGYYGNKGYVFDYINVSTRMALSSSVACRLSNGDPLLWEGTRNVLKGYGMGDIGTAPGVDVNVDLNTNVEDPVLAMCAVELYHYNRHPDYLKLAERICDNIVENRFKDGLFIPDETRENVKLSTIEPMALIAVEAARQGKFDSIDYLCIGDGYIHGPYDGVGRSYDSTVLYGTTIKDVESVSVEKNDVTLVMNTESGSSLNDISSHWAEDVIKLMNAKGIMKGTGSGFEPDRQITRAEFIALLNRVFSFDEKTYQGTFSDVYASDWYANDIATAYAAGLIDPNIYKSGALNPKQPLSREEMASFIAKAMMRKIEATYTYSGLEAGFADSAQISDWAREYVDICVNWGIMEGMTETTFAPAGTATRAQACAVIQRLDDMIEKPLVPNVNAVIFPENATDKRISYTSSNPDIVTVDSDGYMYGVASGNATITVTASGKTSTVNVNVLPAEDWMLSGIYIDGVLFEEFDTFKKDYAIDLVKGTTEIPEITAKNLKGENVKVDIPRSIPGTVTIGSGDNAYTISVTANGINYAVNEDFSIFELETPVDQQMHNDWQLRTNSYAYKGKTAQLNVVQNPQDKNKKSALIDLKNAAPQVDLKVNFPNGAYTLGPNADDDFLAYEVTFMQPSIGTDTSVKNAIYLYDNKSSQVVGRFQLIGSSIMFNGNTSSVNVGTITPGKFHNLKVVMNKKLRTADIYFDGKVIATDILIERAVTATWVEQIVITVLDPSVQMYVDEIKVYTIPENVYEVPVIETGNEDGSAGTGLDKPFTDDFSSYIFGNPVNGNGIWTSKNNEVVVGNPPRGGSKNVGILIPEIVDDAAVDYTVDSKSFGRVTLGENADDKKLVFEFDVMPGNDTYISLLSGDTGSTYAFRMFFQGKNNVVHCSYTPAGAANDTVVYDRLNSKRVYRMKIVIDKQKQEADIYINDSMLLSEAPLYGNRYGEELSLSRIQIATRTAGSSEFYESHNAGWFGNFNIYEEENY